MLVQAAPTLVCRLAPTHVRLRHTSSPATTRGARTAHAFGLTSRMGCTCWLDAKREGRLAAAKQSAWMQACTLVVAAGRGTCPKPLAASGVREAPSAGDLYGAMVVTGGGEGGRRHRLRLASSASPDASRRQKGCPGIGPTRAGWLARMPWRSGSDTGSAEAGRVTGDGQCGAAGAGDAAGDAAVRGEAEAGLCV